MKILLRERLQWNVFYFFKTLKCWLSLTPWGFHSLFSSKQRLRTSAYMSQTKRKLCEFILVGKNYLSGTDPCHLSNTTPLSLSYRTLFLYAPANSKGKRLSFFFSFFLWQITFVNHFPTSQCVLRWNCRNRKSINIHYYTTLIAPPENLYIIKQHNKIKYNIQNPLCS